MASVQKSKQLSLLDTFVLLIILGGFGSWIFLVRSHLDPKNENGLRVYIYRPLLGMALAVAVFVVDVSLHSVVSTANVNQIRRETLILLAFAAGLLSEKTYQYVEGIANEGIGQPGKAKEYDADNEDDADSATPPTSQNGHYSGSLPGGGNATVGSSATSSTRPGNVISPAEPISPVSESISGTSPSTLEDAVTNPTR